MAHKRQEQEEQHSDRAFGRSPPTAEGPFAVVHKYQPYATVVRQGHSKRGYPGRKQGFEGINLKSMLPENTNGNHFRCLLMLLFEFKCLKQIYM